MTIRKKNKFVALLLALLLAVGMLPVSVMAAGSFTLEVGSVTAELKAGETVEVPITATANSGYVAGVLDVSWDKTALELTDVKYSQTLAPKGNSAPIPTNNPGKYTIDFGNNVATENYTGTGEFFKLVFKITDTAAAGDHAISLSGFQIYDFDINELTVTSNPGKVTLTDPTNPVVLGLLGDANEDGKVNIKDATLIQKSIANLTTLTETGEALADADLNTKINIKDATAIQKYIAGMETGFPIGEPFP